MLLYVDFRADETHLLLAGATVIVCVGDEFGVMLFFWQVGMRANGCSQSLGGRVVHEARQQLPQLTHYPLFYKYKQIRHSTIRTHCQRKERMESKGVNIGNGDCLAISFSLHKIIHNHLLLVMGNESNVCKNPCSGDQQEIVLSNPNEEITFTKGQKLEPILFEEGHDSGEPHSRIQKQKSASQPYSTPLKKLLSPAGSDVSAMVSKISAARTSNLNFEQLVFVSPESKPYKQIDDDLIEAPYSVIRLTMSDKLKLSVEELGSQMFAKYEQEGTHRWKLHKKGHYLSCLGGKLYAVLTPTFYYEGQLQQTDNGIVPIGNGILISEEGLYSGDFVNGKAQGNGHYRDIDQKTTFKGIWKDGVLEEGNINHPKFKFQGNFRGGMAYGSGKVNFKDSGFAYIGKFDQGLFHDKNGFLKGDRYVYEGGFEGGRKEGEGCLTEKEQTQKQIKNLKDKRQKYHPAQQFEGIWHKDSFQGRERISILKKTPFRT